MFPLCSCIPGREKNLQLEENVLPDALYKNIKIYGQTKVCISFSCNIFRQVAVVAAAETKPVLLVVDNHGSHISLKTFEFWKQNNIVVISAYVLQDTATRFDIL